MIMCHNCLPRKDDIWHSKNGWCFLMMRLFLLYLYIYTIYNNGSSCCATSLENQFMQSQILAIQTPTLSLHFVQPFLSIFFTLHLAHNFTSYHYSCSNLFFFHIIFHINLWGNNTPLPRRSLGRWHSTSNLKWKKY